jgi:probable H4MPT-linked C1 transfer pathway protein
MGDVLALDIGGANLKLAHDSGQVESVEFAVWRGPEQLATALAAAAGRFPAYEQVVLTMTAELCDCFETKAVGVRAVLEASIRGLGRAELRVWGTDGAFHTVEQAWSRPELAAASNWLALAVAAARLAGESPALLIDVGSTTSDLIPLAAGQPQPRGRTDFDRLVHGELLYAGVRRTPLCALAPELDFRGQPVPLAAELFATTLDVYLTLGDLQPNPHDRNTADGRPATLACARDRLARMLCLDRASFSSSDALELARQADRVLEDRLLHAARRACEPIGPIQTAVLAGSGEFLAHRLADQLLTTGGRVIALSKIWGEKASTAACAYALLALAHDPALKA